MKRKNLMLLFILFALALAFSGIAQECYEKNCKSNKKLKNENKKINAFGR